MTELDPLDDWEMQDPFEHFESGEADVVPKFFSHMEADVAAARLRAEGIPCFLSNQGSQFIQTQTMNMVRLHVRPQDADRARAILADTLPVPDSSPDNTWRWVGAFFVAAAVLILVWMYFRHF
jgi:hypothetical protein